ncbi:MAG: 50S ribosomal protein L9 [Candidatus Aureabacteria bacterium]|nr:50S ribosomal protein L9 [Candidatus Auribacterota bacterium]
MKVVLCEKIDKLGKIGDIVNVSPGYARNYLFTKKLAMESTDSNTVLLKRKAEKGKKHEELIIGDAKELAQRISECSCTISVEAGEEDKLFGAVTSSDIAQALKEEGLEIDKKWVEIEAPIKKLGVYNIDVSVYKDVKAAFKLWIVKK